ncbi:MAG: RES domain-containing protein [Candidatus Nanopelagicales bacterium]
MEVALVPRARLPKGTMLDRIYRASDAEGRARSAWFYSSRGSGGGGRFDLPHPAGTCYLAGDLDTAFREVFREARVIAEDDVACRRALTATAIRASAPWADLAHELATEAGVSLDVFSGSGYAGTQALAGDCHARGDRGVISLIRHQSDGTARGYALFGATGPAAAAPEGWTARTGPLREHLGRLSPHLQARIRAVPRSMRPTTP